MRSESGSRVISIGTKARDPVGSVLVLGGGIAGMQSSLDLANSGYLVHLVTDQPSIGGKMTQLDKTFPTNECAMCLLGPKMTDTLSHPNIRLHTCASIMNLEGTAGNFRAKIIKQPRFIDVNECTACGECEQVCPVTVKDKFNCDMSKRKAVYKQFPQAVPNKYLIEKRGQPPCRTTCPAETNVQGYVALISQGKFTEALEVIMRQMPFPGICGRICHHPCETECNRGEYDQPVAIAALKRAAADFGRSQELPLQLPLEKRPEKVAVIGGGPSGLTAAFDLVRKGYQVTVFDSLPAPGGMMRFAIPRYRLPHEVIDKEIDFLLRHGIDFRPNTTVGKDVTFAELRANYDAVLVAVGAQKSKTLEIKGKHLDGTYTGLEFLKQINLGYTPSVGHSVVVIGAGNLAMDAARSALRLGAQEVHVLVRREQIRAFSWEVQEAIDEGIVFHKSTLPIEIIGQDGKVSSVKIGKVASLYDQSGKYNPQFVQGSEQLIDAENVIFAIGQETELSFLELEENIELDHDYIKVDGLTNETTLSGVFACGDVITGPASVVEAVAAGHRAAESIDRYLNNVDLKDGRQPKQQEKLGPPPGIEVLPAARAEGSLVSPDIRRTSFHEVCLGLTKDEAIAEANRCLNCGICCECYQCVSACEKKVINHQEKAEILELDVGAVVLCPGYTLFDADRLGEFGYGIYPNVMTSLEFERLLSSTGPTQGHIVRPSDQKPPKKVAFIQCVGSRDSERGSEYCSSICCMYSSKEAIIAREHDPNIQPTIFYLDMRSFGKNFDRYVASAKGNGVRYVNCMISGVKQEACSNNLIIEYVNNGENIKEVFDLVVLAVGVRPPKDAAKLAEIVGVELDNYGFAKTNPFNPVETSKNGVFVAGAFQGPRDIPETVMNASAAAAAAGALLSPSRGQLVTPKVYPPEKDVTKEPPRIGVFICHCGINIASVVDVTAVKEFAAGLPGVCCAEEFLYTCSQDTLKRIKEIILEKQLNRVVVASCTIRTHQSLFREALREAGLNQFYFEMANIRDQCSWVHRDNPLLATKKAKDLVAGAVEKVKVHEPLKLHPVPVVQKALIVGGGIAGITAALSFAEQGYESYIIEKEAELGGNLKNIFYTLDGTDVPKFLRDKITEVTNNTLIKVYTKAQIADFAGHQGHFVTTIMQESTSGKKSFVLEHGVIIIATGCQEYSPNQYLFGQEPRVITALTLEKQLYDRTWDKQNIRQVVMIQCVGSRDDNRPYCSRTCCGQSVKNAIEIKRRSPETDVFILYRDLRTYGLLEKYYKQARQLGVIFVRFHDDEYPSVKQRESGLLEVEVIDRMSRRTLVLWPDQLVLATGSTAPQDIEKLATLIKLPLNEDRFFVETHAKLAPIDFPSPGIFLCGAAHSPKYIGEAVAQAQGAVARACNILSQKYLMVGGVVAQIDRSQCAACLTCVRLCPYSVPKINSAGLAEIDPVQCQGCGTCVGECPNKAIQLQHYTDHQLINKVKGFFM